MNIFDWLKNRWQAKSAAYTYVQFGTNRTDLSEAVAATLKPHKAGENYFRLWLVGMSLADDRKWFTAWQPAVYTLLRFRFGDQEETITHVGGPSQLSESGFKEPAPGVLKNYATTALLPFNGGTVELEAGLLAMPGKNDVTALLGTLSEFSKLLAVPELSTALNVTDALASGFSHLVGAGDTKPALRLHETFTTTEGGSNILRPGYFAIVDYPADSAESGRLYVKQDRLCIGDSIEQAKVLKGRNYMLFRIESAAERDDWESLSAIRLPFAEAIDLLGQSSFERDPDKRAVLIEEAERRLGASKLAAVRAKELTKLAGRNQVLMALQKGYEDTKAQLSHGAIPKGERISLATAIEMAISATEAARFGLATEESVLGVAASIATLERKSAK
jgi:hypothetical protein